MVSIIAPAAVSKHRQRTVASCALAAELILFCALYTFVHHWKELIHWDHRLMAAMPIFGVAFVALSVPVGMQLLFLQEYSGLNPLIPTQYCRLFLKSWRVLLNNDRKVSEKDV